MTLTAFAAAFHPCGCLRRGCVTTRTHPRDGKRQRLLRKQQQREDGKSGTKVSHGGSAQIDPTTNRR
jgi:hypothetical protein